MCGHGVQFYDHESFLIGKITAFVTPALQAGGTAIVVATRPHLELLAEAMPSGPGRIVWLDAEETLARLLVDGLPDAQCFEAVIGGLLADCAGSGPVVVFGEMVGVLYGQGEIEAAARLEALWNRLLDRHPFSLLCGYPMRLFAGASHRGAFKAICDAHSQVEPMESVAGDLADPARLHGTIARLQQAADALEHELAQRRESERLVAAQAARISSLERTQVELASQATHDSLTGLVNRRAFGDCLAHAFSRARRTGGSLALLFIDLDDFKSLNDCHGHETGDRLLQEVALRLSRCVRAAETVCRLGGDEFAVVMEDADACDAAVLAQRVIDALAEDYPIGGLSLAVTASVGIGLYPEDAPRCAVADLQRRQGDVPRQGARQGALCRFAGRIGGFRLRLCLCRRRRSDLAEAVADASGWMTVEAAAMQLRLSRPHVVKLIAEKRLGKVVRQHGALPLIPVDEVNRLERELQLA